MGGKRTDMEKKSEQRSHVVAPSFRVNMPEMDSLFQSWFLVWNSRVAGLCVILTCQRQHLDQSGWSCLELMTRKSISDGD